LIFFFSLVSPGDSHLALFFFFSFSPTFNERLTQDQNQIPAKFHSKIRTKHITQSLSSLSNIPFSPTKLIPTNRKQMSKTNRSEQIKTKQIKNKNNPTNQTKKIKKITQHTDSLKTNRFDSGVGPVAEWQRRSVEAESENREPEKEIDGVQ
jgi:hypothetical protein